MTNNIKISRNLLLLVAGLSYLYASATAEDNPFELNGERLSESHDEHKLTDVNSAQKRASWLDFKRDGSEEYEGAPNHDPAKRASWLDFRRDGGNKRASWLDFKRGDNSDLNAWLEGKRASWLDFKKRASWLDFKRNHGDKRASWLDMKRASWLDMKRNGDKRASWLDMKRDSDKRASWLDFKRSGDSSLADLKRSIGSWIEAKQAHKRGNDDQPMDPKILEVIREMLLKDNLELTPSERKAIFDKYGKALVNKYGKEIEPYLQE